MKEKVDPIDLTADIVSAYVRNNKVAPSELPKLIQNVHAALLAAAGGGVDETDRLTPAVAINQSITDEYIICLEDGKPFKSLKRHLNSRYGMTPEEYRSRWSLPADYPMVAPNYAKARSDLAKKLGLGRKAGGKGKTS